MRVWFESLSGREQALLIAAALALGAIGYFLLVIEPLQQQIALEGKRVLALRETRDYLEQTARAATALRAGPAVAPMGTLPADKSFVAVLNSSAAEFGIDRALRRLTPTGPASATVIIEATPFADATRWLSVLRQRYGILVERGTMDEGSAPGLVNLALTLSARPGGTVTPADSSRR